MSRFVAKNLYHRLCYLQKNIYFQLVTVFSLFTSNLYDYQMIMTSFKFQLVINNKEVERLVIELRQVIYT